MKVIDLLNKIANDIDVPPKNIKYNDKYFEYKLWLEPNKYAYVEKGTNNTLEEYCCFYDLNDTVEILEEEKKIPEKIGLIKYCEDQATLIIHNKVDEIIDYLHYLKSKGE